MNNLSILLCFLFTYIFSSIGFSTSLDTPNLHNVETGLYRSGHPTQQGLRDLKNNLKIKTIVDLEENTDAIYQEKLDANNLGINFISLPMSAFYKPSDSEVNQIETLIRNPNLRPLLVHCRLGMDRTGLIVGLHRVSDDTWSSTRAYNEMLQFGFHPEFFELYKYFKIKTNLP